MPIFIIELFFAFFLVFGVFGLDNVLQENGGRPKIKLLLLKKATVHVQLPFVLWVIARGREKSLG